MQKIYAQSTKKAITGVKGEAQTTNKSYALVFNEVYTFEVIVLQDYDVIVLEFESSL